MNKTYRKREKIVWHDAALAVMCQGEYLRHCTSDVIQVHMNFRVDGQGMPTHYNKWFVCRSENPRPVKDLPSVGTFPFLNPGEGRV